MLEWVKLLSQEAAQFNGDKLIDDVINIRKQFQILNKSKSRSNKPELYLLQEYKQRQTEATHLELLPEEKQSNEISKINPLTLNATVSSHVHLELDQCVQKIKQLEETNLKLLKQVDSLSKHVAKKSEKIDQLQIQNKNMTTREVEGCKLVEKLATKVNFLKRVVIATKEKLKKSRADCSKIKQSNFYKRLKRSHKYLISKEKKIKVAERKQLSFVTKIPILKRQIKHLQTDLLYHRKRNKMWLYEKKNLNMQIKKLIEKCELLEAEVYVSRGDLLPEMKSMGTGRQYHHNVRKCIIELQGEAEVASTKVAQVIHIVSKWIFQANIPMTDLPCANTAINMADEGHVLSKYQVADSILKSKCWDMHMDGTTRDQKKYVGQQITLNSGQNLSAGFTAVCTEDAATLLDISFTLLRELAEIYDDSQTQQIFTELLKTLFATMSDRASVMKKFNHDINAAKKIETGCTNDLHMLHCNAHYLLGLSRVCERDLKEIEAKLEVETAKKLGRGCLPQFKNFKSSECATSRFIRTACDVLGPRGDEKNGCKAEWEAYLIKVNKTNYITSFRSNRFNNYFEGATSLFFHNKDLVIFLTDGYKQNLNLKLQSVAADSCSQEIQSLIRALGIVFFRITGPYWNMLQGDVEYVDLYLYVQKMHSCFTEWQNDASPLLQEDGLDMFPKYKMPPTEVYKELYNSDFTDVTKMALQIIMKSFIQVTEKQLSDFLPGGQYSSEPTDELRQQMKHCKLTNLLGEHAFGDLDYSQFKRRHTSLHHHSTLHMLKRNCTISDWLTKKSTEEQKHLIIIGTTC